MAEASRVRVVVRGEVQGVGFRYFVRTRAKAASLRGWVRNRDDGAVECAAEGARPALDQLLRDLRQGPAGAEVEDVEVVWETPAGVEGDFQIVD